MSLTRVQQISVSLDGFATGEGQSQDTPFGHAGERLHEWMFATQSWHERVGQVLVAWIQASSRLRVAKNDSTAALMLL